MNNLSVAVVILLFWCLPAWAGQPTPEWSGAKRVGGDFGAHKLKTDVGDFDRGFGFAAEPSRAALACQMGALSVDAAIAMARGEQATLNDIVVWFNARADALGTPAKGKITATRVTMVEVLTALDAASAVDNLKFYVELGVFLEQTRLIVTQRPVGRDVAHADQLQQYLQDNAGIVSYAKATVAPVELVRDLEQIIGAKDWTPAEKLDYEAILAKIESIKDRL